MWRSYSSNLPKATRTDARSKSTSPQSPNQSNNPTTDPSSPILQGSSVRPNPSPQRRPPLRLLRRPLRHPRQCQRPNDTKLQWQPTTPNPSTQTVRLRRTTGLFQPTKLHRFVLPFHSSFTHYGTRGGSNQFALALLTAVQVSSATVTPVIHLVLPACLAMLAQPRSACLLEGSVRIRSGLTSYGRM